MAQLKATENYIWSLADVLGQGATGAVYMARHKRTGEQYAVKTFSPYGQMRPYEVQIREFEVMRKLKDPNIVGLLAVEEEQTSRAKVIVMELCKGGSLFSILDEPNNAYGLPEEEFLKVLQHVAAGMDHLREQGIVHRDIKPGNILRYIESDGSSVYKLTDFGAARELQEDQPFMSLYGTEEYLHPDMYERALLDGPRGTEFTATVDLWSLGITLYHVATGELPFRPYGGRRNRLTMHKITTEKASGVISGIQKQPNGPIEWSKELPSTCRLSKGLRQLLTPLLARLLECNQQRMLSFQDFFSTVNYIIGCQVIHVFCTNTCENLRIYLEPTSSMANLQEEIARQTDIEATNQLILLDQQGQLSNYVTAIQPIAEYPGTAMEAPLYLLDVGPTGSYNGPKFFLPAFTEAPTSRSLNLDEDYKYIKGSSGVLHLIKHYISSCEVRLKLVFNGAHLFRCYLKQYVDRLHESVTGVNSQCQQLQQRNEIELKMCQFQVNVAERISSKSEEDQLRMTEAKGLLLKLDKFGGDYGRIHMEMKKLFSQSDQCVKQTRSESFKARFAENLHKTCDVKSKQRSEMIAKEGDSILRNFKRDRELKKLSHNEEQLHKFERSKFRKLCGEAKSYFETCCDNLSTLHQEFIHWFQSCRDIHVSIQQTEKLVAQFQRQHSTVSDAILQTLDEFSNWMCSIQPGTDTTTGAVPSPPVHKAQTGDKGVHRKSKVEINKSLENLQNSQNVLRNALEQNSVLLNKVCQLTFKDPASIQGSSPAVTEIR